MQITDIPSWLADAWSISEAVAQVILSVIVIFSLLLPVMYLSKAKTSVTIYLITFFLASAFLVGIGWMPFWIIIAEVAMMAMAVAWLGVNAVGG